MANPTPVYRVQYDSQYLPGYVQSDDRPLSIDTVISKPYGRDGGFVTKSGTGLRDISLTFLVKSELGSGNSGLLHLENCMNQYREALKILTRPTGERPLQIHDTDRYYLATVTEVSAPLTAGESRSINYTVKFVAQPWAVGSTTPSTSFSTSGDKAVTHAALTEARRSYVKLDIASGITALVATDDSGHTIDFTRGSFTGVVTIDTANMTVVTDAGVNAVATMNNLNFGMFYDDDDGGTFTLHVTTYTGTGTSNVYVSPRYEL